MSIKVQNTEDADPFWGFDLLMENEAHVPQTLAEQRQTEDESKKEATTFIQEPEAKGGVIKSSTRGKGKTKEKVTKKEKKSSSTSNRINSRVLRPLTQLELYRQRLS